MNDARAEYLRSGRVWFRGAVPDDELRQLDAMLNTEAKPGVRIDPSEQKSKLLSDGAVGQAIATLNPAARPVRLVGFNKTATSNWSVPWHQDRVIVVSDCVDVEGFGNWSKKAGVWHCEPPAEVLDAMIFVRVHLDAAGSDNGAMEIALGSHRLGVVAADAAADAARRCPTELCLGQRGDVLALNMLTLHRSSRSDGALPRRTLRIDYATQSLPTPLAWAAEAAP